ncbi:MAG: DUF512 domain-containing protein [Defluviitaleaceae bacterium]|nr:DUF512 domain-containing protein [Defluviitaleaceae bacterium]
MNTITKIEKNSIASEMGLVKGDIIVSINNKEVVDIFDYRYLTKNENLEMVIKKATGQEWILEIEKEEDEDLGINFKNPLIQCEKSCKNKCLFCFIDQNPVGMRPTIYFKDDDSRLSFLQGNFVTLTNMSDQELERIIFYRLSPINISVHTTDPKLRVFMLKNPRASLIMEQIKKITSAGIVTNFQVVLCKGINDEEHLDKTIGDLAGFFPFGQGVGVVPVGITKHRENLPSLTPLTKEDANQVIDRVTILQKKLKKELGTRFVFLADEFYILADRPIPPNEHYEDYSQIQNGVGLLRNFIQEFENSFENNFTTISTKPTIKEMSVATGQIAYSFIKELSSKTEKKFGVKIHTYPITNNFYGSTVTVAGLVTGGDIISQLRGLPLGERLLIPKCMLKSNEDIFLDNVSVKDIQKALDVNVVPTDVDGKEFLDKILGLPGLPGLHI